LILRVDEETGLKRQILIPSLLLTGEVFVLLATTAKAIQAKTGMQIHHTFPSNQALSGITGSAAAQVRVV
jgi:hypothetical protein